MWRRRAWLGGCADGGDRAGGVGCSSLLHDMLAMHDRENDRCAVYVVIAEHDGASSAKVGSEDVADDTHECLGTGLVAMQFEGGSTRCMRRSWLATRDAASPALRQVLRRGALCEAAQP
jgi:hypothetical protein